MCGHVAGSTSLSLSSRDGSGSSGEYGSETLGKHGSDCLEGVWLRLRLFG